MYVCIFNYYMYVFVININYAFLIYTYAKKPIYYVPYSMNVFVFLFIRMFLLAEKELS